MRRAIGLCLVGTAALGAGDPQSRGATDPQTRLLACRDLSDATARLACFDRESAALAAAPAPARAAAPASGIPPTPASAAPSAPPPAAGSPAAPPPLNPEQQFGLPERTVAAREVAAGVRASEASKIEAHIAQLTSAGDGRTVFKLDNDQTWRQLLSEGDLLARVGDEVTISHGALGSYWLKLASGRGCKVTRVR
jgi:hypothetical protein